LRRDVNACCESDGSGPYYDSTREPKVLRGKEEAHQQAVAKLKEAWAENARDHGCKSFDVFSRREADLGKILRYQQAHSRSFFRISHELERLQAKRAGEHVPAPAVADVNVNVEDTGYDSAS